MANKIIDKYKLNKEPGSDQAARDRGVGSTASLGIWNFSMLGLQTSPLYISYGYPK